MRNIIKKKKIIKHYPMTDRLIVIRGYSVWMIRISVLVKVNGILVKVNGIRHYSFIELILPCFSHK